MKGLARMRYGFAWVTLALFLFSLAGHWLFGWFAFLDEQREHHEAVETSAYLIQMLRDTLENWQSEFLQLLWQVGGLSFLLFVGSTQSKEGTERLEAKLDAVLTRLAPNEAQALIEEIDAKYRRQ